jgi:hypothetical protein
MSAVTPEECVIIFFAIYLLVNVADGFRLGFLSLL